MQYILLLPQLILSYSVLKWFRELQPDLKDTDTWYKSSKSAGISRFPFNSHFPILLQSHTTEEKHFLVFLLDFLPHYFFSLYAFYPLLPKLSLLFLFHFCFYAAVGVGIHFTVSLQEDHGMHFLVRREDWLWFWYKSLHHTWQ